MKALLRCLLLLASVYARSDSIVFTNDLGSLPFNDTLLWTKDFPCIRTIEGPCSNHSFIEGTTVHGYQYRADFASAPGPVTLAKSSADGQWLNTYDGRLTITFFAPVLSIGVRDHSLCTKPGIDCRFRVGISTTTGDGVGNVIRFPPMSNDVAVGISDLSGPNLYQLDLSGTAQFENYYLEAVSAINLEIPEPGSSEMIVSIGLLVSFHNLRRRFQKLRKGAA